MFRFLNPQVFLRRKKTIAHRKKRNEMKDKDRFSISKTGEEPLNSWFTKPRIQKMLKEIERLRNVNRHTTKYNTKLMKQYVEKAEETSDLMLHRYFADYEELRSNLDSAEQVEQEKLNLPAYLSEELGVDDLRFVSTHDQEYLLRYFPQLIKVLPPRVAENIEASSNIYEILVTNPPEVDQKNFNLGTK